MRVKGRPRSFDRDEALRRAMELFWAKGFEGASLAELTQAMQINPPSLYAAFGSKEALFREAVAAYSKTVGGRIWSAFEAAPSAREAIAQLLRSSSEIMAQPGTPAGCMITLGALRKCDMNASVCDELRDRRHAATTALRQRLERAVAEGELPKTIDCDAMAEFYSAVQHGMSIKANDGASRETLLAIADGAMAAWDNLAAGDG
jgi:AcrR family transcriptional regulator